MENLSEIVDEKFGSLFLIDESVYCSEVQWNRGLNIRLFIHIDETKQRKWVENAKKTFSSVRKKEMVLFRQGIEYLISVGLIEESGDYEENSLHDAAEISIEINSNGDGHLIYFVMMLGSLIIEFSHDGIFQNAQVMAG